MAVFGIEHYRQKDGSDILKVILKPTKQFPNGGYFYADAVDERLAKNYSWFFKTVKQPYIMATAYGDRKLLFHREKAFNILNYYPDCLNHINGVKFDNVDKNLDVVSMQENSWSTLSRGYTKDKRCKSFKVCIEVNYKNIRSHSVKTEIEAILSAYQLELQYQDYRYDFFKDRRGDLDILDLERTGKISEEESVYLHVIRYAKDNAWYVYRYNLFDYFKDNHISIPSYLLNSEGFMVHSVTGQRLCPL